MKNNNEKLKRYLTQTTINLNDEIEKLQDKVYLIDFHPEYALKLMRDELTVRVSECQNRLREIQKEYEQINNKK